jgi:2'-5' RNA ligase
MIFENILLFPSNNISNFHMNQERIYLFSLAISPGEDIIYAVKNIKNSLRDQLNRNYVSVNSMAHITLFSFEANMRSYPLILEEFERVISGLAPFELKFSGFASFPPKPLQTFYVKPEVSSSLKIIQHCSTIPTSERV